MQFRLRTLLASVAVMAILAAFGGHQWRTTRPLYLVEQFNRHLDHQEYERALEVAQTAKRLYPDEPVMDFLLVKADLALAIQQGNHGYSEFCCGGNYQLADFDREWWDQLTSEAWRNTAPKRIARLSKDE
jgi:hypothetical protein